MTLLSQYVFEFQGAKIEDACLAGPFISKTRLVRTYGHVDLPERRRQVSKAVRGIKFRQPDARLPATRPCDVLRVEYQRVDRI